MHESQVDALFAELDEMLDVDKWLYFFQHAETMEVQPLPEPFDEPVYGRACNGIGKVNWLSRPMSG